MGLFRRRSAPAAVRPATSADTTHLQQFVATRGGVEAYLEPRTAVTETTVVLVADSGEWTRRRIAGESAARSFARKHSIPLYEVAIVGYPQRMRDWTEKRKRDGELGPPSSSHPTV